MHKPFVATEGSFKVLSVIIRSAALTISLFSIKKSVSVASLINSVSVSTALFSNISISSAELLELIASSEKFKV